jgi:hypothetical protein|tara:strand:- start:316 stop:900 length:585 start_codon:yes stop_codon:yes gene_type:complete
MGTLFVDNIKHQSSQGSGTITIGASGEIIKAASGSTNNIGIGMADQWRLTSSLGNPSDGYISANLERVDDASWSKIGTGMTESSGIFSFPATGLYLVRFKSVVQKFSGAATNQYIAVSTDSGSSYDDVARTMQGEGSSSNSYNTGVSEALVNVTDASTFRVRFEFDGLASNAGMSGNTAYTVTGFTFIRLGDSQ